MLLTPPDANLFFRLHRTLMFFVNQRLRVIADEPATPEEFSGLPPPVRLNVRDALVNRPELIESFVEVNPHHLSPEELNIVRTWRHLVAGKFYVFRELKKYTVFLSADKPPIAYGVLALSQPFEEVIGPYLPVMVQAVLLPFKDQIVYDGLLTSYSISFGPGIRRLLTDEFGEAKVRHGIVTSLPDSPTTALAKTPKPGARSKSKPASPFLGRWRITHMDKWDQDFVDAEVEGFVQFDGDGSGRFQFGFVSGGMDWRPATRDGQPAVEWSWEGNDEMDPAQGRGWAIHTGPEMHGMIFIHRGDESGFDAKRARAKKRSTRK
jgi:hypothetical protein